MIDLLSSTKDSRNIKVYQKKNNKLLRKDNEARERCKSHLDKLLTDNKTVDIDRKLEDTMLKRN